MDDGPRTGALQLLLLAVGGSGGYIVAAAINHGDGLGSVWLPLIAAIVSVVGIVWLELYARRRAREERELRERRARELRDRETLRYLDIGL